MNDEMTYESGVTEATVTDDKIKEGDVVYLKSGSCAMTVGRVIDNEAQLLYFLDHSRSLRELNVPVATLTKTKSV